MEAGKEFTSTSVKENQSFHKVPRVTTMGFSALVLSGTLSDTGTGLVALCADAKQITLSLEEMLADLDSALSTLREIKDEHAQAAERMVMAAQSALNDALSFYGDYVHRSEELRQRISA